MKLHSHKHRRKTTICPNCGTILAPNFEFCPTCGQENHELNVPIGHLVYEFVESIFHFDIKFWNTFRAIVTRPGKITRDFVDGKRARYVPPARLYVFVAFFFFLMLNKLMDKTIAKTIDQPAIVLDEKTGRLNDSAIEESEKWNLHEEVDGLQGLGCTNPDSVENALKTLPEAEQIRRIQALKMQAIKDTLSKYNQVLPYKVQDALLNTLSARDSTLIRQAGLQINEVWDLKYELSRLINLGIYRKNNRDSLQAFYEQMPSAQAFAKIQQLKQQFLVDSLKRFGAKTKLSNSFKAKLLDNFSMDDDSLYLSQAGFTRADLDVYKEKIGFTIEGVRVSKNLQKLYQTFDDAQIDSLLKAQSLNYRKYSKFSKWFARKTFKQALKFSGANSENEELDEFVRKEFSHTAIKYVSFVMFLMMPIVAFLLFIVFYRLKKYYYEHLIFSVQAHTVLFLILTVSFTLDYFSNSETFGWAMFIGLIYFFISLKNVYQQRWLKTIIKFFMLSFLYCVAAAIFLGGSLFLGFLNF